MALKLSVIGTGYLGATHAACMASLGFEVIGFDTEGSKIDLLAKGKVPFYEPELEDLLNAQIKSGRLKFTKNISDLADADVHFICVGTPQVKGGNAADLTYVNSALESIAKVVKPGGLVVGKSTVPVGKGITFDTGGVSLKRPYESMIGMKSDMAGAAAVLSAIVAMAKVKPKVKVTALLMAAENALSGTAQRPSDVIKHFGGTTVEVLNTDAEGRLVLADGLAYADLELEPDYLVDVATLTGSATLGLGRQYAAMYTRQSSLAKKLHEIGNRVGEKVWHMPLIDDYAVALESDIADLNHLADKFGFSAGSVTAALFLERFVGDRNWVHLDIAGTGRSEVDAGENIKGGTGFGTRLLIEWLGAF